MIAVDQLGKLILRVIEGIDVSEVDGPVDRDLRPDEDAETVGEPDGRAGEKLGRGCGTPRRVEVDAEAHRLRAAPGATLSRKRERGSARVAAFTYDQVRIGRGPARLDRPWLVISYAARGQKTAGPKGRLRPSSTDERRRGNSRAA